MKVSLFTFLRNGVKLGYPFVESIQSALPLADEYVIALGQSDPDERDETRARIIALKEPDPYSGLGLERRHACCRLCLRTTKNACAEPV